MKLSQRNTHFKAFSFILMVGVILLLTMFSINFASSETTAHQLDTDLSIVISSNNATTCNVSYIIYPNQSSRYLNLIMSKDANAYNGTVRATNFTTQGLTCMGLVCTDGVKVTTGSTCREVTYTGDIVTTEQTYVYIIGLIFLLLLIGGIGFIISTLPASNTQDQEGYVIQISWLKYLRPVLWGVIWTIGLGCLFIVSNLGLAYLPNSMVGDLFFVLFRTMFYITIIMVPIYLIWIFYRIFIDAEFKRMIERGIDLQGSV